MRIIDPIEARLPEIENPEEHWLWCEGCRRFFHHRDLSREQGWPRCPFPDCGAPGEDFQVYFWDTDREPADPRWPASTAELRHGMRSPAMEPFYDARLRERIEGLAGRFERTSDIEPTRYVRPFLQMTHDLCWNLTDGEAEFSFMEDLARELLPDLPVWAQTAELSEAPVMLAELRAFFAFAERAGAVPQAAEWRRFLEDDGIADMFANTMRTDRRLRDQRRRPRMFPPGARPKRARRRARPADRSPHG